MPKIVVDKFKFPLFNSTIWVIIGTTVKYAIDHMEDITCEKIAVDEEKKSISAYTYAYQTEDGKKRYMLFFKPYARPGEIAHEAKHIINILFNWHGQKLSTTNDELECYYLEHLVNKVHKSISKFKIKRNKLS